MAKKTTPIVAKTTPVKANTSEIVTTPVRNTAVPPKSAGIVAATTAPARKTPPTRDDIAVRAYLIWKSGGGNEVDNWVRAERELSI